jgi:phage-related baseplate assembly protein
MPFSLYGIIKDFRSDRHNARSHIEIILLYHLRKAYQADHSRGICGRLSQQTWANAQAFASMNNSYLAQYGVNAVVTGITVDAGDDTVLVQVSANLERLFPSVVPYVVVIESGYAEIRAFSR